jgi:hypothetical protein
MALVTQNILRVKIAEYFPITAGYINHQHCLTVIIYLEQNGRQIGKINIYQSIQCHITAARVSNIGHRFSLSLKRKKHHTSRASSTMALFSKQHFIY